MDLRFNRVGAVAASILLLVVALVGASAFSRNLLGPSTLPPGEQVRDQATGNFDQLVVVLMENKNLDEVYGPAAYMTQLADLYSFSEGWASITNPSQPNYIAILGGSTFGVSGDETRAEAAVRSTPHAARTISRSYRTRRSRITRRGARTYSPVRTTKSSVHSTRGRTSSGSRRTTATTCTRVPSRRETRGSRVGCRTC